jgi:hypothetical protein
LNQESKFKVSELHRDRYARTGEASYLSKNILLPCHGIGIRSAQDFDIFISLRFAHDTSHLGFCSTQLAYADDTFVTLRKKIAEENLKFKPTASGTQLKTFTQKTFLAVEPSTEFTYWDHQRAFEKIQVSLETPKFLKDYVTEIFKKRKQFGLGSPEYRKWKTDFFDSKWSETVRDEDVLNDLILQNYEGQKTCGADILIPPTNPIISDKTFEYAKKIIENTASIWKTSTAAYLVLQQSVLKNDDLLSRILEFYRITKLPILILKIKDFEPLDPDRVDLRKAFSLIQETFCNLREKNSNKCTILLEGGKLTYPSLIRGFDIVTNNLSGRNKLGGGKRKKGVNPSPFSRYYVNSKMVFYQHEKMQEFARNELKFTNGKYALQCRLPCCCDIVTIDGLTKSFWNNSIARPHFALSMNEEAKYVSDLVYTNQVQKAKERLLKSELCILKNLIPDT